MARLAADPAVHRVHGPVLSSWDLMPVYGFADIDGTEPDWGEHYRKTPGPGATP